MRKYYPIILLLTTVLVASCTVRPRFGKSPVELLVSSMTLEEKQSLVILKDGHTSALERMEIPSVSILELEEIPGTEMLLRTWNADLAYQAGAIAGSALSSETDVCIMCPVMNTEDTVYSGKMTAAVASGIRDCGFGMIVGPGTPDMENVISTVQPWAVVVDNDFPFVDSFDGPVFVTEAVSDTLCDSLLNVCVAKVLAFIGQAMEKPQPSLAAPVMDISTYRMSLLEGGMVMLKNDDMIPMTKTGSRIALYGKESYNFFDESFTKAGFKLEPSVVSYYNRKSADERKAFQLRADAIASEAAVIVFSDSLDASDRKLVDDVCTAFHSKSRKVAVVLATGGPVQTDNWIRKPDAILFAGVADNDHSSVVARIFKGSVTASGRLSRSWDNAFPFGFGLGASEQ